MKMHVRDLEKILLVINGLKATKPSSRVVRHVEISQEILQCKEILAHSFRKFQVRLFYIQ